MRRNGIPSGKQPVASVSMHCRRANILNYLHLQQAHAGKYMYLAVNQSRAWNLSESLLDAWKFGLKPYFWRSSMLTEIWANGWTDNYRLSNKNARILNKADRHKSRARNSISHCMCLKTQKKVKCDGRTDRPTDRQWLIKSHAHD